MKLVILIHKEDRENSDLSEMVYSTDIPFAPFNGLIVVLFAADRASEKYGARITLHDVEWNTRTGFFFAMGVADFTFLDEEIAEGAEGAISYLGRCGCRPLKECEEAVYA